MGRIIGRWSKQLLQFFFLIEIRIMISYLKKNTKINFESDASTLRIDSFQKNLSCFMTVCFFWRETVKLHLANGLP